MNGKHWACSCLSLCFLVLSEVGGPPPSSFIPHLHHNTLSYQSFYSLKQCFLGTFFCPCFSSALQLSSSSCSCWVNPYPSRPGEKKPDSHSWASVFASNSGIIQIKDMETTLHKWFETGTVSNLIIMYLYFLLQSSLIMESIACAFLYSTSISHQNGFQQYLCIHTFVRASSSWLFCCSVVFYFINVPQFIHFYIDRYIFLVTSRFCLL